MRGYLVGASIQRVDAPLPSVHVLALRVTEPDAEGVTVSLAVFPGTIAVVRGAPRGNGGKPATAETMRWRKWLEGARVVALLRREDGLRLAVRRGEERCSIVVTRTSVALVTDSGAVDGEKAITEEEALALEAAAAEALSAHRAGLEEERRKALVVALRRAIAKVDRRLRAIDDDLARIAGARDLSARATLLSSYAHAIPKGSDRAELTDWVTGDAVVLALDPSKTARANAEAMFARSKRLERGAQIARARREKTEQERAALVALLASAPDLPLAVLQQRAGGIEARVGKGKQQDPDERSPFRTYSSGTRPIHVGRGAADNDALTTKHARPYDLWLHARGVTGAHVVVPLGKQEACPPDLLVDAAHLAAHFSDSRGEPVVDVQYTPRKWVRKPKGSAPGAVVVDREKVLALRVEPARLTRLLETLRGG